METHLYAILFTWYRQTVPNQIETQKVDNSQEKSPNI